MALLRQLVWRLLVVYSSRVSFIKTVYVSESRASLFLEEMRFSQLSKAGFKLSLQARKLTIVQDRRDLYHVTAFLTVLIMHQISLPSSPSVMVHLPVRTCLEMGIVRWTTNRGSSWRRLYLLINTSYKIRVAHSTISRQTPGLTHEGTLLTQVKMIQSYKWLMRGLYHLTTPAKGPCPVM